MSQPNRNERLGALTAGIILVVMAAMLLFTHRGGDAQVPQPQPVAATETDTGATDTVAPKKKKAKKRHRRKGAKKADKQHRAPAGDGPVRDPLSEH